MPKRGEHIHKRKDGRWEARYKCGISVAGKTLYKSVYSSKYFIALLAPVFYLILRLKNISSEKTFLADAVCTVSTHDSGVILSVKSTQQKLCETHNVRYSNTKSFTVNGRKVTIDYIDNTKRHSYERLVEFYILPDDATYWAKLSSKFNK